MGKRGYYKPAGALKWHFFREESWTYRVGQSLCRNQQIWPPELNNLLPELPSAHGGERAPQLCTGCRKRLEAGD